MFLCIAQKSLNAVWELIFVNHPVAQRAVISLTWILITKPSVIHHEEFSAHRGDIAHHLVHAFLVDIEIYALPRVKQYLTFLIAMHEHVLTSPLMEIP